MSKQQFTGTVPQRTAVPFERMVNQSVEQARLDSRLRLQPREAEDWQLREKLERFFRKGETLLAFMGRIGLGPRPLHNWDMERIAEWILQSEANEKETDSKMFRTA
jgi:hypothetical protein